MTRYMQKHFEKKMLLLGVDEVIKESACLTADPITVEHFAYLFSCTPVGRDLDYDGPDLKNYSLRLSGPEYFLSVLGPCGFNW